MSGGRRKTTGRIYGDKDHVKVDTESKLIMNHSMTAAPVHDIQKFAGLVDGGDRDLYADSAFVGKELCVELNRRNKNLNRRIHGNGRWDIRSVKSRRRRTRRRAECATVWNTCSGISRTRWEV